MISKRIHILIILLATVLGLSAQVRVEVSSKVVEDEKFSLVVVVENNKATPPERIEIPNCTFVYGPAFFESHQVTMSGGKTQTLSVQNFTYTFRANKEGTVNIPAIQVKLSDGKVVNTKPQKLTILPKGQRPSGADRTSPADYDDGDVVNANDYIAPSDMFVRIVTDKSTVYEQQPVVATIKFYFHSSKDVSMQWITQPTFEGFLSEDLDVRDPYGYETINGKEYKTYVIKRLVLYPQKSGTLKLTTGSYEVKMQELVQIDAGLGLPDVRRVQRTFQTKDITSTLHVKPLPTPRPASFNGAVGQYEASVDLSSTHLRTNDPATYTITIRGKGNIKYLKTPNISIPAGFDEYTPKTKIDASYVGGDIAGTYTAEFTLVPQEVGQFEIAPYEFTYFNPQTGQYKTIVLQGYNVSVAKGVTYTEQKAERRVMTDIRPMQAVTAPLKFDQGYIWHSLWYKLLYVAAALALVIVTYVYRRQVRLNADVRGRRLARAMREAMKRFKVARRMIDEHNHDKFYAEITRALTGYLSDKLDIPASQLVRDNISSRLITYGLDPTRAADIIDILDDCEMARFTPHTSDSDMTSIYDRVVDAVKNLENVSKDKSRSKNK